MSTVTLEPRPIDLAYLATQIFRPQSVDTEFISLDEALDAAVLLWKKAAQHVVVNDWSL